MSAAEMELIVLREVRDKLLAENAELKKELVEQEASRATFADLLRRTCDALKGPPPEPMLYSWHDLPEVGAALRKVEEWARGTKRCQLCHTNHDVREKYGAQERHADDCPIADLDELRKATK